MTDVGQRLREALVGAYPEHVRSRLADPAAPGLDEALTEGAAWLASALDELLAVPFAEQRRGPLEMFQEAMRFPTKFLEESGQHAVPRDAVAVSALPGDLYDLAPASTRDLGEDVWMAHLAWGAAKAAALREV